MTGMTAACLHTNQSRSYLNHLVFGSCLIHILYTECAKLKKKFRRQKVNADNVNAVKVALLWSRNYGLAHLLDVVLCCYWQVFCFLFVFPNNEVVIKKRFLDIYGRFFFRIENIRNV